MDAPTAPAADSVGVAMPARIDPKTIKIKMKGGTIADSNSRRITLSAEFLNHRGHESGRVMAIKICSQIQPHEDKAGIGRWQTNR